jgi:uncharacterized membrane protein YheB (UPF0754 family)
MEYNTLVNIFTSPWLTIPLISGSIGWFTNWIAVKMLLRPIKPIRFLGLTIQGVIPKRHSDLADRVSAAIAQDFITEADIQVMISRVDFKPYMREMISKKWDEQVGSLLGPLGSMIAVFAPQLDPENLKEKIILSFESEADKTAGWLAHSVSQNLNLQEVIRDNIMKFDLERLEEIINNIAKKEFKFIELLGGVIGLIIGFVQVLLIK